MIKLFVIPMFILIMVTSCTRLSPKEKDLQENLNKTLKLDMFETVQQGNTLMSYNEFRKKFKYISVVYLEDGCKSCYPKFIEWQKKMGSINTRNDCTILFVIQGFSYDQFMSRVTDIEQIKDHYYTVMDMDYKYLHNNKTIPKWIIDSSILINPENKIKMVGAPWLTKEMKELFYKICL